MPAGGGLEYGDRVSQVSFFGLDFSMDFGVEAYLCPMQSG